MNKKQKIATIVFLILFWISCFYVPWNTKRLLNGRDIVDYKVGNIFKAPRYMEGNPTISSNLAFWWAALLINYCMVLVLCSNNKKEETTSQREDKVIT